MGHKNPDTDSICSAIAYAYLKNQLDDSCNYIAARAGQVTAETQYVLGYFHVEQPLFLDNIGTRVKDMEIREVPGVTSDISIKKAWTLMLCFGKDSETLVESAFFVQVEDRAAVVPGVVSRKKQVIPALVTAISRESEL